LDLEGPIQSIFHALSATPTPDRSLRQSARSAGRTPVFIGKTGARLARAWLVELRGGDPRAGLESHFSEQRGPLLAVGSCTPPVALEDGNVRHLVAQDLVEERPGPFGYSLRDPNQAALGEASAQ
jgi:hypothetical protein